MTEQNKDQTQCIQQVDFWITSTLQAVNAIACKGAEPTKLWITHDHLAEPMLQTMELEDRWHRCYWIDTILLHLHLDMSPTAVQMLDSIAANGGATHLQAHIYAFQLVYDHGLRRLASWWSFRGWLNNPKSDSCKPQCKWWLRFLINYKNSASWHCNCLPGS